MDILIGPDSHICGPLCEGKCSDPLENIYFDKHDGIVAEMRDDLFQGIET